MASRCWVRDLQSVSLILMLLAASASAMVIRDGDSTEVSTDTGSDVDVSSTDSSPETPPETPSPDGIELLKKIGWGCGLVRPISNISLDTIMGRWYLLEIISPSSQKRQDACAGVDFWRWDDEENNLMPDVVPPPVVGPAHLVMRGFNRHANEHHTSSYRVDTAAVVQGSGSALWDQPGERSACPTARGGSSRPVQPNVRSVSACTVAMGASVAVLDFTPDARFMTVTTCVRAVGFEWTSVLGRDPNSTALPREALHQRLRDAGLRYVDSAKLQDNSDCVYP